MVVGSAPVGVGPAAALREVCGAPQTATERTEDELREAAVRAALGEEAFAAAWEAGRAMSLDEAIALALDEIREG
jgi:hypothetical protein